MSGQITVSNNTDQEIVIEVILEDMVYQLGDEDIWGLSRWITINPSRIRIPIDGQAVIGYRADIPDGVEGPHWAYLRFIEITQTIGGEDVYRLLNPICFIGQVDPKNLVHGALLVGIGLVENQDGETFFRIQVEKKGTDFNNYSGEIVVESQSRGQFDILPIPEFGILPLHSGQVLVPYNGKLLPDIYQVVVKIFLDHKLTISGVWAFRQRE